MFYDLSANLGKIKNHDNNEEEMFNNLPRAYSFLMFVFKPMNIRFP